VATEPRLCCVRTRLTTKAVLPTSLQMNLVSDGAINRDLHYNSVRRAIIDASNLLDIIHETHRCTVGKKLPSLAKQVHDFAKTWQNEDEVFGQVASLFRGILMLATHIQDCTTERIAVARYLMILVSRHCHTIKSHIAMELNGPLPTWRPEWVSHWKCMFPTLDPVLVRETYGINSAMTFVSHVIAHLEMYWLVEKHLAKQRPTLPPELKDMIFRASLECQQLRNLPPVGLAWPFTSSCGCDKSCQQYPRLSVIVKSSTHWIFEACHIGPGGNTQHLPSCECSLRFISEEEFHESKMDTSQDPRKIRTLSAASDHNGDSKLRG